MNRKIEAIYNLNLEESNLKPLYDYLDEMAKTRPAFRRVKEVFQQMIGYALSKSDAYTNFMDMIGFKRSEAQMWETEQNMKSLK